MLGLPETIRACLFDLDGVLTDTASVHRAAWKDVFDRVLAAHDLPAVHRGRLHADYVDGKPRLNGTRDFLALPRTWTCPRAGTTTPRTPRRCTPIAARKNAEVLARIEQGRRHASIDGSRRYLEAAQHAGLRRVVVSSSANTAEVLKVTGLDAFVEHRVDGVTIERDGMAGKPAPDSFLAGAKLVDAPPEQAVVFEDATSGVEAGHAGGFGYVVGVNRLDDAHGRALQKNGASVVVHDLADLL